MLFRQLFDKETSTYTYLLADQMTGEAVIIDAVDAQLERDIQLIHELGLRLSYAFDTHVHADHITASAAMRERSGCTTGVSKHAHVPCADLQLAEGDQCSIGRHLITVLETPGHTDGCLSFCCESRVMTGDALLIRGCGRTDFQQGDAGTLYDSIANKLFTLPDDTLVYPAHDYKGMSCSTIGEEKRWNPRLTLARDEFISFMNSLDLVEPKQIHVAVPANLACGKSAG
ncbi:MAG: Zn-dependent hydrolase [Zetaproteobacteria bacterium CG12_big_fil_rev_8_21_14_0_65_54_13]|nr:MAG: Zn-dependent hydrolase [Zetaproteobacteria bacterium CG23_combo_of_CG06-09_8_20_14_all_54_7]PIW51435.1 MAG: Zn-dependent hydrolase [Zetaproteobacteria bacterium CG12_big_fil_rev_8_21_14_0_65_54_13]PIX53226.1 MAG: Zn-dependent hydrolase [Zetaproteobacteria bacterium CG_4_10_14_3_um_filter_54_28]PJA30584.1 MAG: Zn-dependent hydrolase [Zetaproteobacteria bacterium CG_4_9_14_3_um_filter_54_145]